MKLFSDLLAVVLFFLTYVFTKNMIAATAVAVVVGILQAIFTWIKYKKLNSIQWASLILIIVFGGATIVLKDPKYIMWKPTLLFWLIAIVMLIRQIMGKNPVQSLMSNKELTGQEITLPDFIWTHLAWAWIVFFIFMGAINIAIAYTLSEAQWVNYKLFGATGLMIVFFIAQGLYLNRYLSEKP